MRLLAVALMAGSGMLAWAQSSAGTEYRTQAIIQVQKTQMGADLVTITVSDPSYPSELLRIQSEALGRNTGSGSRGVHVYQVNLDPKNPGDTLWKSSFAVDGLIDRSKGILHLQPIARAIAGAPAPHTIRQFQIDFDYEPAKSTFLGDFTSPAIVVHRGDVPPSIVYDVTLLDQDPNHIVLFDSNDSAKPPVLVQRSPAHVDWVLLTAFGVGAVAVGALVYSLILVLLRPGTKKRPRA